MSFTLKHNKIHPLAIFGSNFPNTLGLVVTLALIPLLLIVPCESRTKMDPSSSISEEAHVAQSKIFKQIFLLGSKIFTQINEPKKNVLLSPVSIHEAISMLSLGVKPGSVSESDIHRVLGYSNQSVAQASHEAYSKALLNFREVTESSEDVVKKADVNDAWYPNLLNQRPPVLEFWNMLVSAKSTNLKPTFTSALQKHYNASVRLISKEESTQVAKQVNDWAKTAGFGSDLVQPDELISSPGSVTLMSATRVQGWWVDSMMEHDVPDYFYNFGDQKSKPKNITVVSNTDVLGNYAVFTKDPKFACQKGQREAIEELDRLEFRASEIPLIGNMSLIIIDPLVTKTGNELAELERALLDNQGDPSKMLMVKTYQILKKSKATFEYIEFPKFQFQSDIDLEQALTKSGLGKMFGNSADLTEISSNPMKIEKAKHQAVIEVNKNGIKGGALTAIKVVPLSLRFYQCPLRVSVKNPFLFLVRYGKILLFMGHVVEI